MQAHRVTVSGRVRFATSGTEARQLRNALCDRVGIKNHPDMIEPVEVPTTKGPLLEFINKLLKGAEDRTEF